MSNNRRRRIMLALDGLVFAAIAIWTVVYVAAEDSYRRAGVSRWNTYGAKPLTVVAIASSALTALLAGYAASRRPEWLRGVVLAGVLALVLNYFLLAAMSN